MSAFATLFLIRKDRAEEIADAKRRELRQEWVTIRHRFLFFTWTSKVLQQTGEVDFGEYLDRRCYESFPYPYSGFLLVEFLDQYANLAANDFGRRVDESTITFDPAQATRFLSWLREHPIDPDSLPRTEEEISEQTLEMWEQTHVLLNEWMGRITGDFSAILRFE